MRKFFFRFSARQPLALLLLARAPSQAVEQQMEQTVRAAAIGKYCDKWPIKCELSQFLSRQLVFSSAAATAMFKLNVSIWLARFLCSAVGGGGSEPSFVLRLFHPNHTNSIIPFNPPYHHEIFLETRNTTTTTTRRNSDGNYRKICRVNRKR